MKDVTVCKNGEKHRGVFIHLKKGFGNGGWGGGWLGGGKA